MNISNIYLHFWKNFLKFKYAEDRKHFFIPLIINTMIMVILGFFVDKEIEDFDFTEAFGTNLITVAIFIVFTLAEFTSQARRLHDRNLSNWYSLLTFVPILGWVILIFLDCLPRTSNSRWQRL